MEISGRGGGTPSDARLRNSAGTVVMWLVAVVVYVPAVWFWCAAANGAAHPSPYAAQANHAANVELADISALVVFVPLVGAGAGVAVGRLVRAPSLPLASAIGIICCLMAWYWWILFHLQLSFSF
ncbi:hypothetical protein K7472_21230 [Streptomyces sp. PTM05]|uniref:Uncharacterized protein n=1 Tax=Streptantibioticus parmotrematis TaxID=2873249 RepID=A0ABS7QWN8_9ACTN|nr:hypothetical protein [Streptantibioticus parmotrematis]MBY8887343.1 hypothetical protein [Streptantibioticus parmotrematis]